MNREVRNANRPKSVVPKALARRRLVQNVSAPRAPLPKKLLTRRVFMFKGKNGCGQDDGF